MANCLRKEGLYTLFHSATFEEPTCVLWGDPGFARNAEAGAGKIDNRATVDAAVHWIRGEDDESPFFIYMNLQNSHVPYRSP